MPMLDASPNTFFGDKSPVILDDKRIASVCATIAKVVFSDGGIWDNTALSNGIEIDAPNEMLLKVNC